MRQEQGPNLPGPPKTVATIIGWRVVSKDKREQKLVAQHVMSVATYDLLKYVMSIMFMC